MFNEQQFLGFGATVGSVFCCSLAFFVLVQVAICFVIYSSVRVIPKADQQIEPAHVWLLVIPVFGAIWGFVVYPKVAASFKVYFEKRGIRRTDDCGQALGLWLAILIAAGVFIQPMSGLFMPLACMLAALPVATLILLVVYLVKISTLKSEVERTEFVSNTPPVLDPKKKP